MRYIAMFNLEDGEACLSIGRQEAGLEPEDALTELWTGEAAETPGDVLQVKLAPHGCAVFAAGKT